MTCSRQTLSCGSPAQAVFLTDAGDSLLEGFETNSVPIHYLRFKDPKKILGRPGWGREKKRKKNFLEAGGALLLTPQQAATWPLHLPLRLPWRAHFLPSSVRGGDTSH